MKTILRVKKRRQNEWAILFILMLTSLYGVIELVGLPVLKYTMDVAWGFLLVSLALNRFGVPGRELKASVNCIWLFLVLTLVGFIINGGPIVYYLWGFRNNFRFFVFFLACVKFLDAEDIDGYMRLLNKLLYLHFAVAMIQYFIFGYKRDHLGGIFGTGMGNNGSSLLFMLVVMTYSLLSYMEHRKKLMTFVIEGSMTVVIAACSELKAFFVFYIAVVALCLLVTDFSYKKLFIMLLSFAGINVGVVLLEKIFPDWAGWFSWDAILEMGISSAGYTGTGDLNRLTAIPAVWTGFLDTWVTRLFGLGLGNCDNASFSFLTTPFYERYSHLHYNWFSSSFALLETGLLGFGVYILFFVMIFLGAVKRQKNKAAGDIYCQLAKVMAVVSLVLIIYNHSMRTEVGYMMYFVLALPFIGSKKNVHKIRAA